MTTAIAKKATTADELDSLWIGSAALTFDMLVWQAHTSREGRLYWSSTIAGSEREVSSEDLISVNRGFPLTIIFDVEEESR